MEQKAFTLINRGMNRDLSVSKTAESSAYENHNIRILAREGDTMLSVTNERGNKEVPIGELNGTMIGWNVLNNYIILFVKGNDEDYIYRIEYKGDDEMEKVVVFHGQLGFDTAYPIESIVYFETDDIQKIYWVDGLHVLRFVNFKDDAMIAKNWNNDPTYFDSNRYVSFSVKASVTKDNAGNTRQNGTIQYFLTYFSKHGQESGIVWASDLIYLNPAERGGAADETNNNRVTIEFNGLDHIRYSGFRVYSIFRSSLNGTAVCYLVAEQNTGDNVTVVDDGAHLTLQDASSLLYLGSQDVRAGTITHKDETLFLGDLKSIGRDYTQLEKIIRDNMFIYGPSGKFIPDETYKSACVSFAYSDNKHAETHDIAYVKDEGTYPFKSQLTYSSSEILSFKGGEMYRFALKFKLQDGTETDAFWIGDAENELYPVMDKYHNCIKRIVAVCELPKALIDYLKDENNKLSITAVQLCIAEASDADRSVKAQGVINPTMFNVWERYNNRNYSFPTWIARPRHAQIASTHFAPVQNAKSSLGEIQCNYWDDGGTKNPYYQYVGYATESPKYLEEFNNKIDFQDIMLIYRVKYYLNNPALYVGDIVSSLFLMFHSYQVEVYILTAKSLDPDDPRKYEAEFSIIDFASWEDSSQPGWKKKSIYGLLDDNNQEIAGTDKIEAVRFEFRLLQPEAGSALWNNNAAKDAAYNNMREAMVLAGLSDFIDVDIDKFREWCRNHDDGVYINSQCYNRANITPTNGYSSNIDDTLNIRDIEEGEPAEKPSKNRWTIVDEHYNYDAQAVRLTGDIEPSYYKKHIMFVDENVVTFDSPELSYGSSVSDRGAYNFRIIGVSKVNAVTSDYTIDIENTNVSGSPVDIESFSGNKNSRNNIDGLTAWPLIRDYGLDLTDAGKERKINVSSAHPALERISEDYRYSKRIIRYWVYLWHSIGSVSGYRGDGDEEDLYLKHKIIANRHFCYNTIYMSSSYKMETSDIRILNDLSADMFTMNVGNISRYYSGKVQTSLSVPGTLKYPIALSTVRPDTTDTTVLVNEKNVTLYSYNPVLLEYNTGSHAVITFPNERRDEYYIQTVLPAFFESEKFDFKSLRKEDGDVIDGVTIEPADTETGALIPWLDNHSNFPAFLSTAIYPEFEIENYDAEENKLTAYFYEDLITSEWISDVKYAVLGLNSDEESKSIYCRIVSSTDAYLVCVNRYEYGEVVVEGVTENRFRLNEAEVINHVSLSSQETVIIPVDCYMISHATWLNYGAVLEKGIKKLTMNNGYLDNSEYPYIDYDVDQEYFSNGFESNHNLTDTLSPNDRYFFVGELYIDYTQRVDTRYGGKSLSSVQACRFIPAGPLYPISDLEPNPRNNYTIYGNQGDTYFQRWDDLRVKPYSDDAVNGVIDIISVMLETHINLDGRTDKMRTMNEIASIDIPQFGQINPVYSQKNNYIIRRDLDEDFNTDSYRSSITWTLPKTDLANIDEWTHITLASSLKLDGDKGICRALRRFQNNIIAFQDRGIAEVLFNSRVQLSTENGVPIEIGNSGKVDGKRYVSNKYGCLNKWSITEGKNGLYFVDNINKAFCCFGGSIENLSTRLGFSAWMKKNNSLEPWTPESFENIVSFYDRIHSDVYLVKHSDDENQPCLVYSEVLGAFTSFFDYAGVPMMANVGDKFVAYKNNKLWFQNDGLYCNFFGEQYPFWVTYRIAPNPVTDKIWTNLDFQSDFYRVLDKYGNEEFEPNADITYFGEMDYREDETFDEIEIWNEYQNTGKFTERPEKKFRTWRYTIPRAQSNDRNIYGLDRIRNPWINLRMKKNPCGSENRDLMQLHDVVVKYFE